MQMQPSIQSAVFAFSLLLVRRMKRRCGLKKRTIGALTGRASDWIQSPCIWRKMTLLRVAGQENHDYDMHSIERDSSSFAPLARYPAGGRVAASP